MINLQEEKDLLNTVEISARRFEESPFIERHDTSKMIRGVYANRFQAVYIGEDPIQKYWTLRQKALIFDVPEKPIEIKGPDAVKFLDKVLTRKISNMKIGRGYYAIACTPKGGIFMDGVVFRFSENHFWYVQADGPFEMWLLAHSEGFDVEINDPKSRVIQIQGPASLKIMEDATNGQITEAMKYYSSGFFNFNGQELYVSRSGFTGELGYEIYCDGYKTDHGMEFSSTRALTIRRIEGGILGNTTDMDINMSPFEAGLSFVVDLDKEDFVGRKALLNKNKNVLLHGLTCKTATPSSGSKILDGNEEVGYITAGVPSPTLGLGIGYARFLKSKEWPGKQLKLSLPNGEFHSAEIVDLPFFDKEKKIIKGIDKSIPKISNDFQYDAY